MSTSRLLAILTFTAMIAPAFSQAASVFPDVPAAYPYREAVESLAAKGVITGNPDGTFRPSDPVNRAAMLKMLFIAAGLNVRQGASGCLKDVEKGSWYESIVCDAVSRGFVSGYTDGTFKPARPVSRVEALKMTLQVMGIGQMAATGASPYTDLDANAWYVPYVQSALTAHILPIAGQEGPQLSPNVPLERGEAAAYIWNVLKAGAGVDSSSSSSLSSTGATVSSSSMSSSSSSVKSAGASSSAAAQVIMESFPFNDTGAFQQTATVSYRFTLTTALVGGITVNVTSGKATCLLYRLDSTGFSTEYYLGVQDGNACKLQVAMTPGDYQLQMQPSVPSTSYTVAAVTTKGDGNDGFSQAITLHPPRSQTGFLDSNDLSDWFTFTVTKEQKMTLSLTASDKLSCLIYPSSNVSLPSFAEPACNAPFTYPAGTYYVGIGHAQPLAAKQMYTLQLQ